MNRMLVYLLCLLVTVPSAFARTLEEVKKSGVIKIGTSDINFRPVHYRDSQGNRIGIDIDLMNLIALKMNVKLDMVFIPSGLENRINFLLEDQGDLVISNFSITPEREERIDFSIPYLTTGVGIILDSKFKNTIKEFEDLRTNNVRVALIPGSTQHKIISERFPKVEAVLYKTAAEAVQAFLGGETDGYATDELFLRPTVSQNPEKCYLLPGRLSSDPYGVGVSKKYPDLRAQVSMIIEEAIQRGEIQKIIDKHTGAKIEIQPSPSPSPAPRMHTVAKGDSLEKLASKYYGKASLSSTIYEANKDIIPATRTLKVGMQLRIPTLESLPESLASVAKVDSQPSGGKYTQKNLLEYITYLYKQDLISKEAYDEIYEKGRRFLVESQLSKLKDKFSNGSISKEVYHKEQIVLLRELFY